MEQRKVNPPNRNYRKILKDGRIWSYVGTSDISNLSRNPGHPIRATFITIIGLNQIRCSFISYSNPKLKKTVSEVIKTSKLILK